jgi:hypothetical protein
MRMIFGSVVLGLVLYGGLDYFAGSTVAWIGVGVWAAISVLFIGISIGDGSFE